MVIMMVIKPKPIKNPPSKAELKTRLNSVRELMKAQNLDYYISFDPVNIYYLTNFANNVHERPFILLIETEGIPKMIVPLLEKSHVETRSIADLEYSSYYEFPAPQGKNWYDIFQKNIDGSKRVGVESAIPMQIFEKTPGRKVVTDIIDETRIVKTDYTCLA